MPDPSPSPLDTAAATDDPAFVVAEAVRRIGDADPAAFTIIEETE